MPWWWRHAAAALLVLAAAGFVVEWARHSRLVLEVLAGCTVAAFTLGALWIIAGRADAEIKKREQRRD